MSYKNKTSKNKTELTDEDFKRLTVDIPVALHRAIKSQCALRGTKIANEIRTLLANKYQNQ